MGLGGVLNGTGVPRYCVGYPLTCKPASGMQTRKIAIGGDRAN